MIAHHYFPISTNIGDFFVRDGIRRVFGQVAPGIEFVDFPVNGPRKADYSYGLRGENLRRSNRQADLILVGGSNLYEPRRSGKWGVVTDVESIRQIDKPVVLVGLGAGSGYRRATRRYCEESRREILLLNQRAVGSSVRDVRTRQHLANLGITKAVLTGCPATFIFDRPFEFRDSDTVVIAFPSKKFQKHRLGFFRVMRAIKKYIAYCRAQDLRVVISCHDHRDLDLANPYRNDCQEIVHSDNPQHYYELYGRALLVAGFRLHACIACLSLGTPFIPVCFDLRAVAFAETYHSARFTVDGTRSGVFAALCEHTKAITDRRPDRFERFIRDREAYRTVMREFAYNCIQSI